MRLALPVVLALLAASGTATATQRPVDAIALQIDDQDGAARFRIAEAGLNIIKAGVAAEVDRAWLRSRDYPRHRVDRSRFDDALGGGEQVAVTHSGMPGQPDLIGIYRIHRNGGWVEVETSIRNNANAPIRVSSLRMLDVDGAPVVDLGGPSESDRVLSDSYSEDTPILRVRDLADTVDGAHVGIGSQLVYNRSSGIGLFVGALSSDRWLTYLHLGVGRDDQGGVSISALTADCAGTTEAVADKALDSARPRDRVAFSFPVAPGDAIRSERLMVAMGRDYHSLLEQYGDAVRIVRHARVSGSAPSGWWSWTAYYLKIGESEAQTNARWLSEHLRALGYDTLHIDEGYDYARGEYETADRKNFPNGLETFGRGVASLGLKLGLWTAPFEVSERAWAYRAHPEWLVHNPDGEPIRIGGGKSKDRVYALDPTHPGAQAYLRKTYNTLAHRWGARFIKLDFMETSAIEGVYYRPNISALEAQRIGLEVIRDAVGDAVILDKDGSPMLNPVGIVDTGRISNDTEHSFAGSKDAASGIAARYYMNRNFFVADPDAFCVSNHRSDDPRWGELSPVSLEEARVAITLAALAGGMYEIGDDLPALGAEADRLALVQNADLLDMVRLGRAAVPLDLMNYAPEDGQPSVFLLREGAGQAMLAVFNWTEAPRSHRFTAASIDLPPAGWSVRDVWNGNRSVSMDDGVVTITDQPPHSVKLMKWTATPSDGRL